MQSMLARARMMMSAHMDTRDLSRVTGMAEAPGASQDFHQHQSAQDSTKFADTPPSSLYPLSEIPRRRTRRDWYESWCWCTWPLEMRTQYRPEIKAINLPWIVACAGTGRLASRAASPATLRSLPKQAQRQLYPWTHRRRSLLFYTVLYGAALALQS